MAVNSIEGARLKFERAKQHICDLNGQIAAFFKEKACTFIFVSDFKSRERAIRFEQYKPIPDEFALLMGDAIHNLRSTLDYSICDVCIAAGADPERVQFPFAKRAESLESVIKNRQVQLAGPKIVQAIRDLKPYPGGNDDLFGLHMLDIADKHRLLIPTVGMASLAGITIPNLDKNTWAFMEASRGAFVDLKHKQEIVRVHYVSPLDRNTRRLMQRLTEPETDIGGSFHLAFGKGLPFENEPVITVLARLTQMVSTALRMIASATIDQFEGGAN
jgi:hypothetical protein